MAEAVDGQSAAVVKRSVVRNHIPELRSNSRRGIESTPIMRLYNLRRKHSRRLPSSACVAVENPCVFCDCSWQKPGHGGYRTRVAIVRVVASVTQEPLQVIELVLELIILLKLIFDLSDRM